MLRCFLCWLVLVGTLTSCSSVKSSLGMTSADIDPYMVEPQSLALPPDYKIRPPKAGDPVETTPQSVSDKSIEDVLKKS